MQRSGACLPLRELTWRDLELSAGFTLLEIMIAVMVFSVALLGMSGMQLTSLRLNSAAQLKTRIATVGQEHMEELLAQPYASATFTDPSPVGQPTTYCVLYPSAGLSACRAPAVPPAAQGPRPYCVITQQPFGSTACDDSAFAPPSLGYKVRWSVDRNQTNSMAHIELRVSHLDPGQQRVKTFDLSFAKSAFNNESPP
ncbi:MAG: prepilin-type N-terminal cleavage/methylation domain-containing protein [Candidatus Tectimicrobiota bacterium]